MKAAAFVRSRYLAAVILVAIATIVRLALGHWFGVTAPFVTIYPSIILVVLIGGLGPALLAIFLSVIAAGFVFREPAVPLGIGTAKDIATLGMFTVSATLLVIIAHRLTAARADRARRESEEKYRAVVESTNDGIIIVQDGVVTFANPRMAELDGSTVEHLIGSPITDHIDASDMGKVTEMYSRRIAGEDVPATYEAILKRNDGSQAYADLNLARITFEQRPAVLATIRDITQRKQTDEALRVSEARFRALFENSIDAVMLTLTDGSVLAANKEMGRMLGMTEEEVIKAGRAGLAVHDEKLEAALEERRRTGSFRGELFYRKKDGTPIAVEVASAVFEDRDGRALTSMIVRDITERRQMEEELRASRDELENRVKERTRALSEANEKLTEEIERRRKAEREFQTLSENSPLMIIRFSSELRYVYANPATERITGMPNSQRIGKLISEVGFTEGKVERAKRLLKTAFETGQEQAYEGESDFRDRQAYISSIFAPEFDDKGRIESVLVVAHDLTEQHQLEQRLRQAQKMEAIGTLAGGIAHDFNNMLAVVIGNAELALDDIDDREAASRNIKQIMKASKRARELTRQILTFSRKTERGRNVVKLTPLIKETFNMLRGSLLNTVRMELAMNAETDAVLADPSQIQQILINLATNAADAMQQGGVLTVGLLNTVTEREGQIPGTELPAGTYVALTVQDTGTGMSETVRNRIFEPYFTTKQPGKGTGMGLAVVYGIVKSHGGDITVESAPGEGTAFHVFLPAENIRAAEEEQETDGIRGGTERILLVDDEPGVLQATSRMLRKMGYRVATAPSGAKALETFQKRPDAFDVVITDQVMPDLTGINLARKILALRHNIPVILFTGYSESVSSEVAEAAGISAYVMKPTTKQEVAGTLRRVLDDWSA